MPDEPESTTPPATPPAEPGVDLTATLQVENDRLRAENDRLRMPPAAPPSPTSAPVSAEAIEAAYLAGRLTLAERDQAVEDLKFQQRYQASRAAERVQEREADATRELWRLRRQYPELGQAGSPLLGAVEDRLRILASRGSDPTWMSTQLTAVEWVLAQREGQVTTTRQQQEGIPVQGGAGTFGGGPPSTPAPKNDFADIPLDVQNYWTRTGIPKEKWAAYAAAYRANRDRRAARRLA